MMSCGNLRALCRSRMRVPQKIKSLEQKRCYHRRVEEKTAQENLKVLQELEGVLQQDAHAINELSNLLDEVTGRKIAETLSALKFKQRQATTETTIRPVPFEDLKALAIIYGLPFVGFGFVDNFIMIIAGDYIDLTLGVSLGISSMAAAGIGNTISDVAGLGLGGVVEDLCARLGLRSPVLSQKQLGLKQVRMAKFIGNSVGVTIGCLLGMFPLLFLETRDDHAVFVAKFNS